MRPLVICTCVPLVVVLVCLLFFLGFCCFSCCFVFYCISRIFCCVLSLGTCVIFNCLRVSAGSQLGYKNLLICSAAYSIHTYIQTQPLHHPQSLFSPQNKRNFLLISLQAGMKQKRKGNPKTIFGPAKRRNGNILVCFLCLRRTLVNVYQTIISSFCRTN